jgi:hypothetical protein
VSIFDEKVHIVKVLTAHYIKKEIFYPDFDQNLHIYRADIPRFTTLPL